MPTGIPRLLAFLHPLIALATIALVYHVATLGLRSRQRRGEHARPAHRQRAPVALAMVWLSALSGIAATWLWRDDLELGGGWHFWIGLTVVALLTIGAVLSRRVPNDETARKVHPALGLLALLFAALQIFFGMPMLPF